MPALRLFCFSDAESAARTAALVRPACAPLWGRLSAPRPLPPAGCPPAYPEGLPVFPWPFLRSGWAPGPLSLRRHQNALRFAFRPLSRSMGAFSVRFPGENRAFFPFSANVCKQKKKCFATYMPFHPRKGSKARILCSVWSIAYACRKINSKRLFLSILHNIRFFFTAESPNKKLLTSRCFPFTLSIKQLLQTYSIHISVLGGHYENRCDRF